MWRVWKRIRDLKDSSRIITLGSRSPFSPSGAARMPVYDDPETLQALETVRARLDAALGAEGQRNGSPADVRAARRARQLVDDAIGLLRHAASVAPRLGSNAQEQTLAGSGPQPDAQGLARGAALAQPPTPGAKQTEQAQVSFVVREPSPAQQAAQPPVKAAPGPKPALGAARSKQADVTIVDPHAPAIGGKRPPQRPDAVARFLRALTGE
jgi:hypothetical protein